MPFPSIPLLPTQSNLLLSINFYSTWSPFFSCSLWSLVPSITLRERFSKPNPDCSMSLPKILYGFPNALKIRPKSSTCIAMSEGVGHHILLNTPFPTLQTPRSLVIDGELCLSLPCSLLPCCYLCIRELFSPSLLILPILSLFCYLSSQLKFCRENHSEHQPEKVIPTILSY